MRKAEYETLAVEFLRLLGEAGNERLQFRAEEASEDRRNFSEESAAEAPDGAEKILEAIEMENERRIRQMEQSAEHPENQNTPDFSNIEEMREARTEFRETMFLSGDSDMNEISEFFRRDSRRYDNGF